MKTLLLQVTALALLSTNALAVGVFGEPVAVGALKHDPMAGKGCMQRLSLEDSHLVISKYGFSTSQARPAEVQTLGTALSWLERVNNGRPPATALGGYTYHFYSGAAGKHSEQQLNKININRDGSWNFGENQAQLLHELGHRMGNNGLYEDYWSAMGGAKKANYCNVSGYAKITAKQGKTIRSNENFAEVFAAYLTRPDMILHNDQTPEACQRAYRVLSGKLFPGSGGLAQTCALHQENITRKINMSLVSAAPVR